MRVNWLVGHWKAQGFCPKPIFICQKAGRICEKQLKKKSEFLFLDMLILMCLSVIYQIKRVALTRQFVLSYGAKQASDGPE